MRGKKKLFFLVTSFLLYLFDVGSDVLVALQYYRNHELWWFGFTLALIIIPSIIVNIWASIINFNILKEKSGRNLLICVFQLSMIQFYKKKLCQWKEENWYNRCCEKKYWNCSCEDCKSFVEVKKKSTEFSFYLAFLSYVKSFTESAPQWCLQNYIMLRQWSFPWYIIVSTVFSLLSLAWSITSLEKATKIDKRLEVNKKPTFPKVSRIVFLVWQLCILISRLSAFVIFAYVFRYYVFVVIGVHWVSVIVVISISVKSECNFPFWKVMLIALLTYFPFLFHMSSAAYQIISEKLCEKKFKVSMFTFYFVLLVENAIMVSSVWWNRTNTVHIKLLKNIELPLVFGGFGIAILFHLLYYCLCHPSKVEKRHEETPRTNNIELSVRNISDTF